MPGSHSTHVRLDNGVWALRPSFHAPKFILASHVQSSPSSPDHFFISIVLSFPSHKPIHTYALVDCGATNSFISLSFANRHSLPRRLKDAPVPITAVDDRPIATGFVTHDVVASVRIKSHSETLTLGVVSGIPYPLILGLDWLQRHNPAIDWAHRQLTLSCCGANPALPVFALNQGRGLGRVNLVSSSQVFAPTSVGLGLGLNGRTPSSSRPPGFERFGQASPSPTTPHSTTQSALRLSSTILPHYAPHLSFPVLPRPRDESGTGRGQTGSLPLSVASPGFPFAPLHSTPVPAPSTVPLNIAFINSARFRKYARNNPTAVLQYHPLGSPGYAIAAASLGDPPATSHGPPDPPPEPPPPDDFLSHVPEKYHAFASVFSPVDVEKLPPHRPGFDASIEVEEGKSPPFGPLYHLSQDERKALFEYVESNLSKGFIRRSTSPAGSPVLFVRKKTGELRLCVDYRGLNAITKKNRYPLPLVDDLLDRVQGCKLFTVIDLKNAFNLIRIHDGDEWKTAFRTHLGLFEYTVMPFGLTNAPGIFQGFIQDVLRDLLDVVCVVYIDDILIFSRSQEEHDEHVKLVLDRLRSAGLFANAKKCSFDQSEVEYLGFLLGTQGIKMNPHKLDTIADWPPPASIKDVQSFLGFTNFYRRFIDRYARIVAPLNALTRKDRATAPFVLTDDAADAFHALKHAFTSSPLLRHFDPSLPSTLCTDASDFAIAGVLHQPDPDGLLHPVAYFSRKLTPAEINYEVYDKELLAIVESFRDMRAWLIGTDVPVAVVSDHKNLEHFMSSRVLNRHQARWSMFLSEFNFRLDYAPGLKNPADAPSRRADFAPREGDAVLHENHRVLLTPLHTECLFTQPASTPSTPPLKTIKIAAITTLSVDNSELLERYKTALAADSEWRDALARGSEDFKVEDNLVFHLGRLFVPLSMRPSILHLCHDSAISGHPGRARTLALVSRDYSWPGIASYVRNYVRACDTCGRIKTPRHKPFGLLQPLAAPFRPWGSITMDYIVKLPLSHGYDSIWVVCDRLTRYAHFIPCNESLDAPGLAWLFLDRIFRYHGLPDSIISDRGSTFVSEFWRELTSLLQVELRHSTAYHPQTDGLTERTNQTLEGYLRAYVSYQQDDWVDYLPLAEFAFNNHVNSSTKQTPFFATYGFHPAFSPRLSLDSNVPAASDLATRLERLHAELRAELKHAQDVQARYYNKRVSDGPRFKPGDLVWLLRRNIKTTRPSDKLDHRRLGPFPVDRAVSDTAYKLHLPTYLSRLHPVFHISLLEPYHDPSQFHAPALPAPFELAPDDSARTLDSILDARKLGQRYEYLVRWKGLSAEEDSWVPLSEIPTTSDEMVDRFHRRHPRAPRPPAIVLSHSAHTAFNTNNNSSPSAPQVPSVPTPSAPAASAPRRRRAPAVPSAAPRPRSPAPVRQNLRSEYVPPMQTTLRSGRVSRPPQPPDVTR